MAKNNNLTDFLTDVANAIRAKKGTSALIDPQNFSSEIASITGGGDIDLSITEDLVSELEDLLDVYFVPTSASNFKFSGNTITGYTGNETDVVIPKSYSISGSTTTQYIAISFNDLFNYCLNNNNFNLTYLDAYGNTVTIATEQELYDKNYEIDNLITNNGGSYTFNIINYTYADGNDYQVTTIGQMSFASNSTITSVTILSNITSIEQQAFVSCLNLASVKMSNSIANIGANAFQSCSSLTTIKIPSSVTTIGTNVFQSCSSLTSITVDSRNNSYKSVDGVLFNYDLTTLIQYPIGNIRTSYSIPSTVTTINARAFYYCTNLTSITVPNSVTTINSRAFGSCTNLAAININATSSSYKVTSYSSSWFYQCSSSLVIHIPTSVSDPSTAYGSKWNYYSSSGTLTYYADL